MKEPELEENNLLATVNHNTIFITRTSLTNDNKPVEIISPSGLFSDIDLEDLGNGKQTGKINASEQGIWKLSYKNDMIDVLVGYENSIEFNDVRATDKLVKDLSKKTQGKVFWIKNDLENSLPKIKFTEKNRIHDNNTMQLIKNEQFFVKGIEQVSLAHWTILLILTILSIFITWYRESK